MPSLPPPHLPRLATGHQSPKPTSPKAHTRNATQQGLATWEKMPPSTRLRQLHLLSHTIQVPLSIRGTIRNTEWFHHIQSDHKSNSKRTGSSVVSTTHSHTSSSFKTTTALEPVQAVKLLLFLADHEHQTKEFLEMDSPLVFELILQAIQISQRYAFQWIAETINGLETWHTTS